MIDTWQARLAQIAALDDQVAEAKQLLAELLAELVEPKRAAIKELEATRAQLKLELDIAAVASVEAGGPKTFGGVQVRRSSSLDVLDADAAIAALRGATWKGKPLVKEQLDTTVVTAYLRAMDTARPVVPGLLLVEGWSVAILRATSQDEGDVE